MSYKGWVKFGTMEPTNFEDLPVGGEAFFHLYPDSPVSRVQSMLSDFARRRGVKVSCRRLHLLDTEDNTITPVIKVTRLPAEGDDDANT